jgi:hypothetical protein
MLRFFLKYLKYILFFQYWNDRNQKYLKKIYEDFLNLYESWQIITYGLYYKIFYYLNFRGIPLRHVAAIKYYDLIIKYLKEYKITYFLSSGCLLGAVRQAAFAGRPNDIDIGIYYSLKKDKKKLKKLVFELKKKLKVSISISHNSILLRGIMLIELEIFNESQCGKFIIRKHNNKKYFYNKNSFFTLSTIKIYNFISLAPKCYMNYINDIYKNDNWKIAVNENFFYKKNS